MTKFVPAVFYVVNVYLNEYIRAPGRLKRIVGLHERSGIILPQGRVV